jgi:DNA-binding transcriptional LysR family regulator
MCPALGGTGLIQVPHYSVQQELGSGMLVEPLPDTRLSPTPVYVLYPRNHQLSVQGAVVIDWGARTHAAQAG